MSSLSSGRLMLAAGKVHPVILSLLLLFVRIFKSIPLSSPNESPICKIQGDKLCLLRQFCSAAVSQYALPPNFHIVHKEKDLRAHPLQNAKAHAHQPALHF